MKTPTKASHSYDSLRGQRDSSESKHFEDINNLQRKSSAEKFRKTPEEKIALKKAKLEFKQN